ncbi:MAG: DUF2384 domain-containing protein [Verrucomicrobiae bacterium]|nr:DUF2384 domain-containing protein [Verrucomicrobiae bacterium]
MKTISSTPKEKRAIDRKAPSVARRLSAKPTFVVGSAFDVKGFCGRFQLIRPDLTRLTGYSQRSVDQWATGDTPSSPARKQLKEVARLFDALSDVMEAQDIGTWLKEPNPAFDGSTPLQVIERGENDRLWRMIYQLQTGEPL